MFLRFLLQVLKERNLIVCSFGISLAYQEYLCTENVSEIEIVLPSRTKGRHAHCFVRALFPVLVWSFLVTQTNVQFS